ncbi:calcium-binding protein [Leptolyngbyaceae cyanobacterium CCMR0082]|uniref:Calcium-binding protein n=2 Tax=Adonisia turfae TaxID=2950184 RepID=A0A6M0SHP8_9CYAN|nr:CAP domain-containing protein [Adonisia turfae]MDV3353304.1 CAP domain-containing protein [Leptothoe sp. LEGE 181152]NEZ56167.1 calcium-binding protein [Adonisia turfae CCMR0081]NEZ67132.1 calcium-binding protein [Adonisia turfae CCMR0082]
MQINAFEREVLELTNEFRAQNGLKPLVFDQSLNKAADQHSKDMAQKDFFSHQGQNGSSPADRAKNAGYESGFVGENIAAGYRSAQDVVDGWINSPGHRANLLNSNYNEIGIGYYFLENDTGSVNYNSYWTQVFGKGTIETSSPNPPSNPTTPKPPSNPTNPKPPSNSNNNSVIRGTNKADKLFGSSKSQRIFGRSGNDVIDGKGGNDTIYGNAGRDILKGGDGDDTLHGGSLNDKLYGGAGNDRLLGGTQSDVLVGGDGNDRLQGTSFRKRATEKDIMTGGNGRDTFVLGNKAGAFYDDGKAKTSGLNNYALIKDFKAGQGDIIQLSNDHDYRLGSSPKGVPNGQALFIDNGAGQKDELIAVIQGAGNLNLSSSSFQYV